MSDRLARALAASALAVALIAAILAGYAVTLGNRYLEDVRVLGEAMRRQQPEPMNSLGPPPQLAE